MAGESAAEVARRRRDKAERMLRQAEMFERGAEGEAATARVLESLPSNAWTVFHDVRWPGRRFANVDHIVIGPPGVFVVDSKNWSGNIKVKAGVLRQNGYSREKSVAGAAEAGLAVARLIPRFDVRLVHPVLCFVRDDDDLGGWARDVAITTTGNLTRMLTSRPAVLGRQQIRELALDLDAQLRDAMAQPEPLRRRDRPVPTATPPTLPAVVPQLATRRVGRSVGSKVALSAAMLAALVTVPSVAGLVVR